MKLLIAAFCAAGLMACNYDVTKGEIPGGGGPPQGGLSPGEQLSFQNVMEFSIRPSCLPCHAAPRNASGVNLESYETVFANRAIVSNAVSTRFMPDEMGGSMTDEQRDLLLRWIAAGAPRTAPSTTTSLEEVTL